MHLKIYLQNTFISLILILFLPQSINAEEKKIIINTSKKEIIYDVDHRQQDVVCHSEGWLNVKLLRAIACL